MRMMGIKSRLRWSRPHIRHCAKMTRNSKSCLLLHNIRMVEQQVGHCVVLYPDPECRASVMNLDNFPQCNQTKYQTLQLLCRWCCAGAGAGAGGWRLMFPPLSCSNYHCGPQLCATLSPDPLPTKVSTKFCKAQYSEKNFWKHLL